MSWEPRARGGRYYTRSRKVNGRTIREYVGTGEVAAMADERDRLDRERREQERTALRLTLMELDLRDDSVKALHRDVDALAHGALLAAGYYRHHGEWRRRRAQSD